MPIDFRLLGPLEVVEDGRPLPLGGPRERALLALLLLNANRVVPRKRLIDELWGPSPPPTATNVVQKHISSLRKLLGERLITRRPGYLLRAEPGELDCDRFAALLERARKLSAEGALEQAAALLDQALALWRDDHPLADLLLEGSASRELERLDELRAAAVEERVDIRLELGEHAESIVELQAAVARHPLRERLRAELMLALYRSGRQAEALEVYRDARETLVQELGIEPGPALRQLEQRILAQDAALNLPVRPAASPVSPAVEPSEPAAGETRKEQARVSLVGRKTERDRVDRLLQRSRSGRSETLVVRGEAGIGKTALLRYAVGRAGGMCVLKARGMASESEMPFSGLLELLRPLLDRVDQLPTPQAAALASALAIGPPVEVDRFAISVATLSLLALAAESAPVLVAVDDLHWLDTSSGEALLFAARRLDAEPVALLFSIREGEPLALELAGLPQLVLTGLNRETSLELLATHGTAEIAPEVAEQLAASTGGNPLALLEIASLLSPDQLVGRAPLEDPLPTGAGIERVYARQIGALGAEAQTALLLAALGESDELDTVLCALHELGVDTSALEHAETAGLVTIENRQLDFRHPLLRAAVYSRACPAERRAAHRALASAYSKTSGEKAIELYAWHLAAATLEPDEAVADALARAGSRARNRSGYAAAARAFEQAAKLSPEDDRKAARLLAAAEAWQLANRTRQAVELLEQANLLAHEPLLHTEIVHLRGKIDAWSGPAVDAHEQLMSQAEALAVTMPEKAAAMITDAVTAAITCGDLNGAVAMGRRACELARHVGGTVELLATLQLGKALVVNGKEREGRPLIMRCEELFEIGEPLEYAYELALCAPALITIEEYARTDRVLRHVIDAARAANALGLLPYCLGALAELDLFIGRWTAGYANGFEAVHLAREAEQEGQLSYNLARLAQLEAAQGRAEPCRAHVDEALRIARAFSFGSTFPFAWSALGLLELGQGRSAKAIEHLIEAQHSSEASGISAPARIPWRRDLVESYVRCGQLEEAEKALQELERRNEGNDAASPLAAAARCRGLLAGDTEFEQSFETALSLHAQTQMPFELARTELCYGERLRRAGRRIDARVQLRSALEIFDRLGADPWAKRARAELAATGQPARSRKAGLSEELTSQELQVALTVARGATNKEAGAALFLTPKTIEFHLAKIYRKLDIRSRTELALRVAEEGVPSIGER
ncbi:MAG: BTAD domain-containing putative transcriptional regulator [Gaiellaceae bacterium]